MKEKLHGRGLCGICNKPIDGWHYHVTMKVSWFRGDDEVFYAHIECMNSGLTNQQILDKWIKTRRMRRERGR